MKATSCSVCSYSVVVVAVDLFRKENVHNIVNIQNSDIEIAYFIPGTSCAFVPVALYTGTFIFIQRRTD